MPKLGLKDVLSLRAAGYSKKEIEALAAVDDENEKKQEAPAPDQKQSEAPAPAEDNQAQDAADKESNPEPDYKQLYEDLKKQYEDLKKQSDADKATITKLQQDSDADKATITKLQQDNVHKNAAPAAAELKAQQSESLLNMVRDFM